MALAKPGETAEADLTVSGEFKVAQARSSVGERHLDVVDVVGSIPSAPTKITG
jgi:hypothetical protein